MDMGNLCLACPQVLSELSGSLHLNYWLGILTPLNSWAVIYQMKRIVLAQ